VKGKKNEEFKYPKIGRSYSSSAGVFLPERERTRQALSHQLRGPIVVNVSDASNIIISSQPTIITTQQENAVMISSNVNDASPYRLCRFWPPSG
jgi:hypothetical protein